MMLIPFNFFSSNSSGYTGYTSLSLSFLGKWHISKGRLGLWPSTRPEGGQFFYTNALRVERTKVQATST